MMSEDEIQAATVGVLHERHMKKTEPERQPQAEIMKGSDDYDKRVRIDAIRAESEYLAQSLEVWDEKSQ